MKQSLQLRLGQQITMTPQLQQAIRLLQLSTLDLHIEIQQALESNIMLEVADNDYELDDDQDFNESNYDDKGERGENGSTNEELSSTSNNDDSEIVLENFTEIPDDLATDSNWEDTFDNSISYHDSSFNGEEKDYLNQSSIDESLQTHLLWQLELTPFSELDRAIAISLIDSIDGDGYLRTTLEDVTKNITDDVVVTVAEVEAVLHRIQHFDPIGIGARDLSECLLLQLSEFDKETPWLKEARILIRNHLNLLATHDYTLLMKKMKLDRDSLIELISFIQSLNPRPGSQLESLHPTYVVPDVFVKKVKGVWKVDLNPENFPKLRINSRYANAIATADKSDVSSLKSHLQEARWFIKSLKSRHETLLKVAKCIVRRQTNFLEYGEEAMKPLVLHDIARELEMHESTISRVTTQKYIHTHRGIFELKYFFSSHVSTDSGGECSSTAIRALIKKLIAAENIAKPLSDSKIAKILSDRGINVARRTVAKYREAMVIPPSNERKRLA